RSVLVRMWYSARRLLCRVTLFLMQDAQPTQIDTLSLHDALPICPDRHRGDDGRDARENRERMRRRRLGRPGAGERGRGHRTTRRSEEHTSELQSENLVCRLLLEKKNRTSRRRVSPTRCTAGRTER